MGADEEVEFRFVSDMRDVERELGRLPKTADTAGRKMADKMDKHFARVEKKGKKAFGASKKEGTAAFAEIGEAGDRVMSELGGVFGDIGGAMSTFIESGSKAGTVLGGTAGMAAMAAGAIAGVTLALGFGAMQVAEFIGGADEMIDRLEQIAGSEALPDDTISQLEDWDQAALGAEASATRLKVVLAGELAGAFIGAAHVAAVAADNLADAAEWAGHLGERLEWTQGVVRLTTGALSLGGTELARWALGLDELAESASESADGLVDLAEGAALSTTAMNEAIRVTESFVAIQEAAILAMTGASSAEIAHFRALELLLTHNPGNVSTEDHR